MRTVGVRRFVRSMQPLLPDRPGVKVLCYHLIGAGTASPVDIPREVFWRQLLELKAAADVVPLEAVLLRSAADAADTDVGLIFRTQNVETRVLVRDGQTVVGANLTVTEHSEVRSGIPLLMDLPLLGGLFRTTAVSDIQRDLLILVTPNIVQQNF